MIRKTFTSLHTGIAIVMLAAACSSSTAPVDELNTARRLWTERAPEAYQVVLFRSCECTQEMAGPVVVTVRNGVVQTRRYQSSGIAVPDEFTNNFPGVEGLFEDIVDILRQKPARFEAIYDPVLGYPTRIAVDFDRRMADDEFTYTATEFRALTGR